MGDGHAQVEEFQPKKKIVRLEEAIRLAKKQNKEDRKLDHLHGEKFFEAWDDAWGIEHV